MVISMGIFFLIENKNSIFLLLHHYEAYCLRLCEAQALGLSIGAEAIF